MTTGRDNKGDTEQNDRPYLAPATHFVNFTGASATWREMRILFSPYHVIDTRLSKFFTLPRVRLETFIEASTRPTA